MSVENTAIQVSLFFLLFLLLPTALANTDYIASSCLDSDTTFHNHTTVVGNTSAENITYEACQNGCYQGNCREPSFINSGTFWIYFSIPFLFIFIGSVTKQPGPIILGSLIYCILGLMIVVYGISVNGLLYNDKTVWVIGTSLTVGMFYILLKFATETEED